MASEPLALRGALSDAAADRMRDQRAGWVAEGGMMSG